MTIRKIRRVAVLVGVAAWSGFMASCADHAERCELNGTCPLPAAGRPAGNAGTTAKAGSANGGATASGGTVATGGTSNTSAGAATAGTSSTTPCGTCSGATPLCDPNTNRCVSCLRSTDCTDSAKPLCETTSGTCVACLSSSDCKSATASKCDAATHTCTACAVDSDCASVTGKPVCLVSATAGNSCVQCTGKKTEACGDFVCESAKNICSFTATPISTGLCQPCVSDKQCRVGQYCLPQLFNGQVVGNFCFWKQGYPAGGAPVDCTLRENSPYVNPSADLTSLDGETGSFCTLAVSTCKALNDFRVKPCTADTDCGVGGGKDAKCVPFGATQMRCTTVCSSDDDCSVGHSCLAGTSPRVCSLTTPTGTGGTNGTGTAGTAGRP